MTLNQAKRFYEFAIGQVALDHGNLSIRTLSGKLYAMPADTTYIDRSHLGFMCGFWINKKSGATKNAGICGTAPQPMTELTVDYLWDICFA